MTDPRGFRTDFYVLPLILGLIMRFTIVFRTDFLLHHRFLGLIFYFTIDQFRFYHWFFNFTIAWFGPEMTKMTNPGNGKTNKDHQWNHHRSMVKQPRAKVKPTIWIPYGPYGFHRGSYWIPFGFHVVPYGFLEGLRAWRLEGLRVWGLEGLRALGF